MKSIFPIKAPWSLWITMLMTLNSDRTVFFIHALEAQVILASILTKAMLMVFFFCGYGFFACWGWDMFSGFHCDLTGTPNFSNTSRQAFRNLGGFGIRV
jgi:hypothetical protein